MDKISDILLNRRTIRKYSKEPVSETLLNELLNMACRASTTGNMQVYSVIITRDEEKKRELCPLHFNQKMVTEAPVVLTFCADFNRFNKWCSLRKADPGYDNFLSFITAANRCPAGCTDILHCCGSKRTGNMLSWDNNLYGS